MFNGLLLSLVATSILSGTLALVSVFLWLQTKHRYLWYLTWGWALYFGYYLMVIADTYQPDSFLFNSVYISLIAFAGVFLLMGVMVFGEISVNKWRWCWLIAVANSLWGVYWSYFHNYKLASIPAVIAFGILQILMGVFLFKVPAARRFKACRGLGLSIFFWGLHKFDYPILRYIPDLAPFGFYISSFFALVTAVFMLILMLEETWRERDLSSERFSVLFKNSQDLIYFFDLSGRIIEANQAAVEKYGYSKEELLNMTVFQLRGDANHDLVAAQIAAANQNGAVFETTHFRKNGSPIPVEVNAVGANIDGQRILISIIRDISERKRAEAELKKLYYTDRLTGLANRSYLEESLTELDTEANLPIAILMGDVNGLKFINDAFGHKIGDDLLKELAKLISDSCRLGDLAIRWGGDEFLLFLPNANARQVEDYCNKLTQRCREIGFFPIQPSIALGYAIKESANQDIQEIFKIADDRMYRHKLLENKSARNAIIASLQNTLFERSYETEQHAERLKLQAFKMGEAIGLPADQLDDLALLATLHDVGKIAIPEEILGKPGALTQEEWQVMMKHPSIGHRIIKAIPDLAHIAAAILAHHERWDGKGYPQGLQRDEIPLIARIISIVDSYDAMTHKRVYQEAISHDEALAEIARCSGGQFDPLLVEVFLKIFNDGLDGISYLKKRLFK